MAVRAAGRGRSNGIDGAILETGLGSAGAVLEADLPEAGRRRPDVGSAASGAGAVESRTAGAEERLFGRRTSGEAAGGTGADLELCARCRPTPLADSDAPKVPTDAR